MSEFQHSIVLFSGADGLPLEFNVRNTNEKALLKAMIEHGGGLCSQSENAVHLITPRTKVLNADLGKKLVSTRYIFDCVKQNYLLDVNDYIYTISEAKTSDISDEDSGHMINEKLLEMPSINLFDKPKITDIDMDITPSPEKFTVSCIGSVLPASKQSAAHESSTLSNTSESFIEGSIDVNPNPKISSVTVSQEILSGGYIPLTSTARDTYAQNIGDDFGDITDELSPIQGSQSLVSPKKTNIECSHRDLEAASRSQFISNINLPGRIGNPSPTHTAVSSSQPTAGDFDDFDNMLLSKVQQKPQPDVCIDEECLSQSYTVSSSADAQAGSKPNSAEIDSAEIFAEGSSAIPDSPTQNESLTNERYAYIKKLEAEVEEILQKPSPKSIQDKICLVKYICIVKKLSPAAVLQSLPHLK